MTALKHSEPVRYNPSQSSILPESLELETPTLYVYILASGRDGVFYVGIAQDIVAKVAEQKSDVHAREFTSKHGVHSLVYYETFDDPLEAMKRHNRLSRWESDSLVQLIEDENSDWVDLYNDLR